MRKYHHELQADIYDAAAEGLKKTIKQLVAERDQTVVLNADNYFLTEKEKQVAQDRGLYKEMHKYTNFLTNEVVTFGKTDSDKAAYEKRIKTLQIIAQTIESGEGDLQQIKERFYEIQTFLSEPLGVLFGMHSLIEKGQDPLTLNIRQETDQFFQPIDMEY